MLGTQKLKVAHISLKCVNTYIFFYDNRRFETLVLEVQITSKVVF